mmetsp:Transcript_30679/g.49371  ORF Transcript_30679/g.49371 Transcript_30679/m.49371 type:complete len:92 (-) Transcript_30679:140-415(-)
MASTNSRSPLDPVAVYAVQGSSSILYTLQCCKEMWSWCHCCSRSPLDLARQLHFRRLEMISVLEGKGLRKAVSAKEFMDRAGKAYPKSATA